MFENIKKFVAKLGLKITALAGREYMGMSVREWFGMMDTGIMTSANIFVDSDKAKKTSVVYSCLRILGGTAGSLPCQVFQRKGDNSREPDTAYPLYRKLHDEPSPLMSAFTYWQNVVCQIHLHGNSYSLILRDGAGRARDILLLDPLSVTTAFNDGHWNYIVDRTDSKRKEVFDQDDILDFPNLFLDLKTNKALSTIQAGAQAIGLSLATERHSSKFFANAAVTNLALKYPGKVSSKLKEEIKKYIQEKTAGENAWSPLILSEGGTLENFTMNAGDAQLIESRQFQVVDVARLFGLPPWMVGAVEKTTSWGAGIEQQMIGFVIFALRPLLSMIENELNRKLFREYKRFAEFNVTGLLRGDNKSRFESYRIALGGNQLPGFMSQNEIRKLENLSPDPDGDTIYTPTEGSAENGQTIETIDEQSEPGNPAES